METIKQIDKIQIHDGTKNYTNFIHLFASFIMQHFEHSKIPSNKEKLASEKMVADSLFLLEKLHLHIFYSFYIYEKYFCHLENPLQSNTNFNLLKKLQQQIKKHNFISEENQELCEKIVSQILTYYPQSDSKIKIILSPISPPWIANL